MTGHRFFRCKQSNRPYLLVLILCLAPLIAGEIVVVELAFLQVVFVTLDRVIDVFKADFQGVSGLEALDFVITSAAINLVIAVLAIQLVIALAAVDIA
jgi:hypothetical protein